MTTGMRLGSMRHVTPPSSRSTRLRPMKDRERCGLAASLVVCECCLLTGRRVVSSVERLGSPLFEQAEINLHLNRRQH